MVQKTISTKWEDKSRKMNLQGQASAKRVQGKKDEDGVICKQTL